MLLGRAPPRMNVGAISGIAVAGLFPTRAANTSTFGTHSVANQYGAEAAAYFNAMVVKPDATRKAVINTFIESLKLGAVSGTNIWAKLDALWLFAGHNSAAILINAVNPGTGDAVLHLTPTVTTDVGITTNGTDNYIELINPVGFPSVKYAQNSATVIFGSLTDSASSNSRMGQFDGTDGTSAVMRTGTSQCSMRMNQASATSSSNNACPSSAVMCSITRTSSSAIKMYLNNVTAISTTATSTAINSATIWLGGRNTASLIAGQFDFACVGEGITTNENTDIYNARVAYRTSLGY